VGFDAGAAQMPQQSHAIDGAGGAGDGDDQTFHDARPTTRRVVGSVVG